jgi:O-antigen/teichoic acid export membrane protein
LFGEQILATVFGAYYGEGAAVLVVLSLGQLASVFAGSCGVTLAMTGHQALMMTITVISGGLTVAAGLLAVTHYGTLGVACATAGGLALQNALLWSGVRYTTGLQTHVTIRDLPGTIRALRTN